MFWARMKDEPMNDESYERLIDALDRLPNGFPRTPSRVELRLLAKMFSPDEAWLASQLRGEMEPPDVIAARVGLAEGEVSARLKEMARRGLVWLDQGERKLRYRLAPFVVGSYEAQMERMDHELAHLVETYFDEGGAAGIMGPAPALHRVIPAQAAVKSEWVLPYDDVRAILLAAKAFRVRDCICRAQQAHLGRKCRFPLENCLSFSAFERPPTPGDISQEAALALLDRTEEVGLVHTVSNVMAGIGYVCNCCGCCCGILRGITAYGVETSVAHANYFAVIDPEACLGCGACVTRCQVAAIYEADGVSVVDRPRCIGCGLCVTGCPNGVARLERKPAAEIIHPPADFAAWEHERLRNRRLID
jgi:NAD-dependent dihydropyrimidine dehydrogenase PreA subunit